MTFNAGRSKNPKPIKLNGIELEEVKSFKLVGVHMDPGPTWKSHLNAVMKKIGLFLHILARSKKSLPTKLKLLFYNSLLKSHIEYCLCIWGNSKSVKKLQTKQNHILRIIANKRKISHISSEYPKYGILKVADLYELSILKQAKKMFNHKKFLHRFFQEKERTRITRSFFNTELEQKLPPLRKHQSQINYMLPKLWNQKFANYRDISMNMATKNFKKDRLSTYQTEDCRKRNCFICNNT